VTETGVPAEPRSAGTPGASETSLRVVVTGKGGVGKTTLTATLARRLARQGLTVLAVDGDAQMNLGAALGLPPREAEAIVPLCRNAELVTEKTGASSEQGWGLLFRLNPDLADVVDRFGLTGPDGVRLLVMGTLTTAGGGCLCPETTLLAGTVRAIGLREREVILLDTQAGVEHFGRALARGFGHALVIADPTYSAMAVADQAARMARDLGIPGVHLVVNRVRDAADRTRAFDRLDTLGGFPFTSVHVLPWDERALDGEPAVTALLDDGGSPFSAGLAEVEQALAGPILEVRA
jgi:CO dehydrogenase maturation factor